MRGRGWAGGAADDEFGFDGAVDVACCAFRRGWGVDLVEDGLSGEDAHLMEWLADGGEAGVLEGGGLDVVEAYDGDVIGDAEAGLAKRADGCDSGDVVEGEEGGEGDGGRAMVFSTWFGCE